MRKLILFIATSLDGFIAGSDGNVDWLFTGSDYGTKKFMNSVDTIFMGRKTYEQVLQFGFHYYSGKKVFVFSKSTNLKHSSEIEIIPGDTISFIKKLKRRMGKNIWLMGGGNLISSFQNKKLVDEYHLFVHPIMLGKGIPLFTNLKTEFTLKLINKKIFEDGLVKLSYVNT
jgi:dihydrofolate reductase